MIVTLMQPRDVCVLVTGADRGVWIARDARDFLNDNAMSWTVRGIEGGAAFEFTNATEAMLFELRFAQHRLVIDAR
jgi:hypothetical protein